MEQNASKYDEIINKNRMRIGTEIEIEIRTKIYSEMRMPIHPH